MEPERFDAIVLGTGQAGKPLALDLAGAGRRTAVVEGSTLAALASMWAARPPKPWSPVPASPTWPGAADYGVRCGPVGVDMAQVRQRKQAIVDEFRTGGQHRLEKAENVELIFGEGRFTGPKGRRGDAQQAAAPGHLLPTSFSSTPAPAGATCHRRARFGPCPRLHVDHGVERVAGASAGPGGRLHRPGIRPDVSPLRQCRHRGAAWQAASGTGGPGRCRGSSKGARRGRHRDPARDRCDPRAGSRPRRRLAAARPGRRPNRRRLPPLGGRGTDAE